MTGRPLVGRDGELAVVDELVGGLERGRPFVLAVRGDPGSGRSALLDAADDVADRHGVRVLAARGIGGDEPIGPAALDTLLRPLAVDASGLNGTGSGTEPSEVATAAVRALTTAAADGPVVLLLDDAAQLDQPSAAALAVALGRIGVEPVGAIAVVDDDAGPLDPVVTRSLPLPALAHVDLCSLVAGETVIAPAVADAVATWAGGSPRLALELARSLRADERDGSAPLPAVPPSTVPAVGRLQRRLDELDPVEQRALVVAAADGTGSASLVAQALVELGEPAHSLDRAEATGLLSIDDVQLRFVPALARPLAYRLVGSASRRAAHRALAATLVGPDQAAQRVEQLVRSTLGADDAVAALVDLVADAQIRTGAVADAAQTYATAARLSSDIDDRARRLLASARAHRDGGDPVAAIGAAAAAAQLGSGDASAILDELERGTTRDDLAEALSPAELRVAESVASGLTNRQAAEVLFLSAKTVDFHLQSIYRKLAIRSRAELATRVATRGAAR